MFNLWEDPIRSAVQNTTNMGLITNFGIVVASRLIADASALRMRPWRWLFGEYVKVPLSARKKGWDFSHVISCQYLLDTLVYLGTSNLGQARQNWGVAVIGVSAPAHIAPGITVMAENTAMGTNNQKGSDNFYLGSERQFQNFSTYA